MVTPRPLHDLLADLVGAELPRAEAVEWLRAGGYGNLPEDLVADAIASYADTAPLEVAEHLAPFVTAHLTGRRGGAEAAPVDPVEGLEMLATASTSGTGHNGTAADTSPDDTVADEPDLDFGAGAPQRHEAAADVIGSVPEVDRWRMGVGDGIEDLPEPTPAGDEVDPWVVPAFDELDGDDGDDDAFDV